MATLIHADGTAYAHPHSEHACVVPKSVVLS